ncbi:MAG: hypothetical protein ACXWRG_09445 [Bdellovibrio sp.]
MEKELNPAKKFQRKTLLINKRVQLGIILYASFFAILGGLEPLILGNVVRLASSIWPDNAFVVSLILAVLPVLFFLLAIIMGFYFSNRIAGPIYNIEKHMRGIIAGNKPSPVHLRQNDYFQELGESYMELLKHLPDHERKEEKK